MYFFPLPQGQGSLRPGVASLRMVSTRGPMLRHSWRRSYTAQMAAPKSSTRCWLTLDAIVTLTEDDTGKPALSMYAEDGPPSVSQQRVDDFGAAIWAVYDLRQLWKSLGPKVETIRKEATPGRNDPCPCGSGKKYKKCHGAGTGSDA